jgi:radical SAM superfamily enzyme YgiQ (UPF0313 family)
VHSGGAIEIAQLCKRYHPESLVLLGGFTATWFDKEILRNYPIIDFIIRGEAEETLIDLLHKCNSKKDFTNIANLSYSKNNKIYRNPIRSPNPIDNYNFTKIDLLHNWEKYLKVTSFGYHPAVKPRYWLNICRGCLFDCIHCGGSHNSYEGVFFRSKICLRSPTKVAEDIRELIKQNIQLICLTHDPLIFGRKYYSKLLHEIRRIGIKTELYLESYRLPTSNYIKDLMKTFEALRFAISPESPSDKARIKMGRNFTNTQFYSSINTCEAYEIPTDIFFTVGLPDEDKTFLDKFKKMVIRLSSNLYSAIMPPCRYTIDPNCQIARDPKKFGVKLFLKTFEDYRKMTESDNPIDWIGHETKYLSRSDILKYTMEATQYIFSLPTPPLRPEMKWK